MSELIKEINVEEIVNKPKSSKPRMSKIVSKAVLLKQISDSKLIVNTEIPTQTLPPGACAELLPEIIENKSVEQIVKKLKKVKKVDKTREGTPLGITSLSPLRSETPLSETPLSETPLSEGTPLGITLLSRTSLITSYKCDLCNTVFTSKVLYERHPRTIRHKTNLIKEFEAVNK